MGFFTVGNLFTLGLALLFLFLFRYLDKNNRNMRKLRDYSEALKKDLSLFMEEQEKAIKDYGVSLKVERDSAKELMRRLQITEEELAEKAAMVSRIDEHIKSYEKTLSELERMTSRLQENANRVREESAFVETTNKRINEAKSRLVELEKSLESIESRFEQDNAHSLEKAAEATLTDVRIVVSDLVSQTETVERRVEDLRQEISRSEQTRAATLAADVEHINHVLKTAVEQAGKRADKIEDAALANLKEQAEQRIQKIKSFEEERLKTYSENAKARVAEVQELLKKIRSDWQEERSDWESKDKALQDERKKDIHEAAESLALTLKLLEDAKAAAELQTETFSGRIRRIVSAEEETLLSAAAEMRQKSLDLTEAELKKYREGWQAERSDWESNDKALREERAKELLEIAATIGESNKRLAEAKAAFEAQMEEFASRTKDLVITQENLLVNTSEEMKQKALEIIGAKLEEYRLAQEEEFRRLQALADDVRRLDEELRLSMKKTVSGVREDFAHFVDEAAEARKTEAEKFDISAAALRKVMEEIEGEVTALKGAAYDNVSEKLKSFEDDFFSSLSKRGADIDVKIVQWQNGIEDRLSLIGDEAEKGRKDLEQNLTEEMRKTLAAQDTKLLASLERLKAETNAFSERIQGEITASDESVVSLKEQLTSNLQEAKEEADIFIKAEIGKYYIETSENIKLHQREFDVKLRELSDYIQTRNSEISSLIDASRSELGEAKEALTLKVRELDDSIEDVRRRVKDMSAENDSRITTARSSVEDVERHIKEAVAETKIIDKAEALRIDLAQRIEDLKTDIERIDQRRAEAFQLENDFVKIKRLQDDVNAKMTRFLSERRKIETMESDFNRLLKISHSVEEKLAQVSGEDDTLQGIQLQIRKLEEALNTTEEKFLRIERKNQILENTNEGVDRNFRVLQESEKISLKIGGELERYAENLSSIQTSIERLSGESEKAHRAVDKIEVLDKILEEIEERIDAMQRARQWVAGAETRLEELNRQAQTQARAIDSLVKGGKKTGAAVNLGEGAPPPQKKENVITLAKQGWKTDEIAKALKISRGEVELILDMQPLD